MNGQDFSLKPFSPISPLLDIELAGNIARAGNILAIRYDLRGDLAKLVIPGPADRPFRRRGLWEETCCEFFLGVKGARRYWEFNLSPAGHWNVYRFTEYRQGMAEETAFASLSVSVRTQPASMRLSLYLEIKRIVAADQPLEIGLAAVIKFREQGLTYWALTHPGPQADFHRRDSFIIALSA
jgi:hypothetical protein